jgi:hypothetical protein
MRDKNILQEQIEFLKTAWEKADVMKTQYSRNERTYLQSLLDGQNEFSENKISNLVNLVATSLRGMDVISASDAAIIVEDIPQVDLVGTEQNILLDWSAEFMPPSLVALNQQYKDRVFLVISEKFSNQSFDCPKFGIIPNPENPFHFAELKNANSPHSILPVYFFPKTYDDDIFYDNSTKIDNVFSSKVKTAEVLEEFNLPFLQYTSWEKADIEKIESFQGDVIVTKVDYLNGGDGIFFIPKNDVIKALQLNDVSKLKIPLEIDSRDLFFQEKIISPDLSINSQKQNICFRIFINQVPNSGEIINNGITVRLNIENQPANFCHGGHGMHFTEFCEKINVPPEHIERKIFELSKKALLSFNEYFRRQEMESQNLQKDPVLFFNLDVMLDNDLNPYILEVGHLSSGSMQMMTSIEKCKVFINHFRNISNYIVKKT